MLRGMKLLITGLILTAGLATPSLAAQGPGTNAGVDPGVAINVVWILVCGFLVMFMQAGFAMVETGFTRAKNVSHTMAMNLMIYGIGMLGYWICGFAFQMGGIGSNSNAGRRITA